MTKPISLSQKSKIIEFVNKNLNLTQEQCSSVWDKLAELDSGTASDIIKAFYDRNNGIAISQLKHLQVIA